MNLEDLPEVLATGDVARLAGVDPKTVLRWANAGKLSSFRTPAVHPDHPGHRRFYRDDVLVLLKSRASVEVADPGAAWATMRELLDAGHEVTFRQANGGYEVECGKTVAGTVYRYGATPEAAVLAAWDAIR